MKSIPVNIEDEMLISKFSKEQREQLTHLQINEIHYSRIIGRSDNNSPIIGVVCDIEDVTFNDVNLDKS